MESFAFLSTQLSGLLSIYYEPGTQQWRCNGDEAGAHGAYGLGVRSSCHDTVLACFEGSTLKLRLERLAGVHWVKFWGGEEGVEPKELQGQNLRKRRPVFPSVMRQNTEQKPRQKA